MLVPSVKFLMTMPVDCGIGPTSGCSLVDLIRSCEKIFFLDV